MKRIIHGRYKISKDVFYELERNIDKLNEFVELSCPNLIYEFYIGEIDEKEYTIIDLEVINKSFNDCILDILMFKKFIKSLIGKKQIIKIYEAKCERLI